MVRLGNKLRLTSRHVSRFLPEQVATCRQLEEVEQQLAWVRRQLLDSLEDRSEQDIVLSSSGSGSTTGQLLYYFIF